jgi:Heterokaryon incompatibility protein (HET)
MPFSSISWVSKYTKHSEIELECTIYHVKISGAGYQALSYEWGSSETPFQITVRDDKGGKKGYIPLTANLNNALKGLRDVSNGESKRFWIDQICINQADDVEKGYQVQLMDVIYKSASRVIVYLGPHAPDLSQEHGALDILERLHAHFEPIYKYLGGPDTINRLIGFQNALLVNKYPDDIPLDDPNWLALLRIVYSAWMRRMWMVQEAILCPNTVMLRGSRILDWFSVASIPILFHLGLIPPAIRNRNWQLLNFRSGPITVYESMVLTWRSRLFYVVDDKNGPLPLMNVSENMNFYAILGCKDPRDRIFSLLGVSKDAEDLGIVPNYRRNPNELFVSFSVRQYLHTLAALACSNICPN